MTGSEYCPVAGFCNQHNELSDFVKGGSAERQLLEKDSAARSQLFVFFLFTPRIMH
jgi:hypothetical protein